MSDGWREEILGIVRGHGGEVSLQEIYLRMETSPLVTAFHREPWCPGGQPRYQCQIRRRLTDLVRTGDVIRVRTGVYKAK